jgi:hypothetical protein
MARARAAITAVPVLLLVLVSPARDARSAPAPGDPSPAKSTVLLELFTSQGCSSCPPADSLLQKLARERAWAGRVVPLAFHVDYWNDLGWRDPFSAASWSDRQRRYAGRLGTSVYTPQLVVDGVADCVGARELDVRRLVALALARPDRAEIRLRLETSGDDSVLIRVSVRRLPAEPRTDLDTYVALFEDGLSTSVRSGENAGRRLENDRVVRTLDKVAELPAPADERQGQVEITLEPAWHRQKLGVVAFAQSRRELGVYAAAEAKLPGTRPLGRD